MSETEVLKEAGQQAAVSPAPAPAESEEVLFVTVEPSHIPSIDLGNVKIKGVRLRSGQVAFHVPRKLVGRFAKHQWVANKIIVRSKGD